MPPIFYKYNLYFTGIMLYLKSQEFKEVFLWITVVYWMLQLN